MTNKTDIPGIDFDQSTPVMDRGQIDMLLMVDRGDGDSEALIRTLFRLFKTESAEKLTNLEAVCAANDTAELRKMVHFVSGSAGNLGLAHLAGFYRALEHAIVAGRLNDLGECAIVIRSAFDAGCAAFSEEFDA